MLIRVAFAALVFANLVFFGWSRGWLDDAVGVRARGDREPERLARQLNPERIVVLGASGAASGGRSGEASGSASVGASNSASGGRTAATSTVEPTGPATGGATVASTSAPAAPAASGAAAACLEAGPFGTAEQATAAVSALRTALPGAEGTDVRIEQPGGWHVYMGSYPDRDAMRRKAQEIRRPRLEIEEIALPGEGEFGLSLGRFDDRAGAERALAQHQQRGIRTARVVQAGAPTVSHRLRVERADAALASQLKALRADAFGAGFMPCATLEPGPR